MAVDAAARTDALGLAAHAIRPHLISTAWASSASRSETVHGDSISWLARCGTALDASSATTMSSLTNGTTLIVSLSIFLIDHGRFRYARWHFRFRGTIIHHNELDHHVKQAHHPMVFRLALAVSGHLPRLHGAYLFLPAMAGCLRWRDVCDGVMPAWHFWHATTIRCS